MPGLKRASLYFVAHQDDWQLFMMPEISKDIADKECKVSIVHLTAGDAGNKDEFWKAREQGSIDSLLFRLSVDEQVHQKESLTVAGNKNIHTRTLNNCSCYFLRLPDGNYNGSGFERHGHQSLEKFYSGTCPSLNAVDKSAVYNNWQELTATIDDIINIELLAGTADPISDVYINFPDPDEKTNPFDHNDHYNTGRLIQGTTAYGRYSKRAFVHYNTIRTSDYLYGDELFWKMGMFSAYHLAVYELYGHSTIAEDSSFIPWCQRSSSYRERQ